MNIIEPIVGKMSHPTPTYPTPISPNPRLVGLRVSCARPTNGIRIGHSAVMSGVSAQLSRVLNISHTYCSQENFSSLLLAELKWRYLWNSFGRQMWNGCTHALVQQSYCIAKHLIEGPTKSLLWPLKCNLVRASFSSTAILFWWNSVN